MKRAPDLDMSSLSTLSTQVDKQSKDIKRVFSPGGIPRSVTLAIMVKVFLQMVESNLVKMLVMLQGLVAIGYI